MMHTLFENKYTLAVVIGSLFGFVARLSMLRTDYRQYPTYPHGQIIHLSLGIIAAGLGAVAVPSLFEKNYTAMTFLALAAQQFRDVRNMERETLTKLDQYELVPRGGTYIEGIAMVFEGRNYLVIFTAFITSFISLMFAWYWGVFAGIAALIVAKKFKSGGSVSQIADISMEEVRINGPDLYVGDIYIMNVGLKDTQAKIQKHGLGLMIYPKGLNGRITLSNLGQRQAILHNLSIILGVYRDSGEPSLLPLSKLDLNDGRLAVFILPQEHNADKAISIAAGTPLLESALRMPTKTKIHSKTTG